MNKWITKTVFTMNSWLNIFWKQRFFYLSCQWKGWCPWGQRPSCHEAPRVTHSLVCTDITLLNIQPHWLQRKQNPKNNVDAADVKDVERRTAWTTARRIVRYSPILAPTEWSLIKGSEFWKSYDALKRFFIEINFKIIEVTPSKEF